MRRFLILYSTVDGHTLNICRHLQGQIEKAGNQVVLEPLTDEACPVLAGIDKIVIGASIRYGKHRPAVLRFMQERTAELAAMPSAFFSVNAVARKPGKNTPEGNPYLRRFLKQLGWRPRQLAVFAGRIDYPRYDLFDRNIIRLIMWLTKGPTDVNSSFEFTDWQAVEAFGQRLLTGND